MKPISGIIAVAIAGLFLTGCFDGSGSNQADNNQNPGAGDGELDTRFILAELDNTSDDQEPFSVNDRELRINDQQAIDARF